MLKRLTVKNFALIDSTLIQFKDNFSVITGETGAGKSILLGAIGLISGDRADTQSLGDKKSKCVVEAVFDLKDDSLVEIFREHDIDYESECILRREVNPEGKSRAFINDSPVNLNVLKIVSSFLLDVHSQHETLLLNNSFFQFNILDSFSGNLALHTEYKKLFNEFKSCESELRLMEEKEINARKESDYLNFQYSELDSANLKSDELEKLETEFERLSNSESIKSTLIRCRESLDGGEENILSGMSSLKSQLAPLSKYGKQFEDLFVRINSAFIELKDIVSEIQSVESDIPLDPMRLEEAAVRIDLINRLLKKHQVKTTAELIQVRDEIKIKLNDFSSLESSIEKLKKQIATLRKNLNEKAVSLAAKRRENSNKLESAIKKILSDLGMPSAGLVIELKAVNDLNIFGSDELKILFSANKGMEAREIHKVASGGELSRLMLAFKYLLAQKLKLPSIIFDEIDTGVSGEVAGRIAGILAEMGKSMQVIAITHLPQIACKGLNHYFVFKEEIGARTISNIKILNDKERVTEVAKMLSSGAPTDAAIKNAKDLLKQ